MPNFCLLHTSIAGSPFDLIRISVPSSFHTKPLSGPWLIACKLSCFLESEIKSQSGLLSRCKDWLEKAASLFTPSLCMLSGPGEGRVRWIWLLQVVVTNVKKVLQHFCALFRVACWNWNLCFNCLWLPACCDQGWGRHLSLMFACSPLCFLG